MLRFDRAHFAAFGDSSYDFELDAFAHGKIELAHPTRTLLVQRST